ncbi:hypothetical protein ACRS6B_12505 [Nocardia asteroides]
MSVLRREPHGIAAPSPVGDPAVSTRRVTYGDRSRVFPGPGETNFPRPLRGLDGFHPSVHMPRLAEPMRPADIDPLTSASETDAVPTQLQLRETDA